MSAANSCPYLTQKRPWARSASSYNAKVNLIVKVLDFIQLGGPTCTEASTIFELWLGGL